MSRTWPTVRLGEVLTPVSRFEAVSPTSEYRLLGIRLDGNGPFRRETVLGSQSSAAKLSRVAEGDFIYSRLFAWRGAFGVIKKELDGCYVSGEFPTFVTDAGRVDVQFLRLWFRLPSTIARVDEDCTGSTPLTRNRFKEHYFLALEIPLPSLAAQRRIVARIEALAAQIEKARQLRHQAVKATGTLVDATKAEVFAHPDLAQWTVRLADADLALNRESRNPALEAPDETFFYVDISSVPPGPTVLASSRQVMGRDAPSRARRVIRENDIILSTVRPNLRAIAKIGPELDGQICSTGFAVISCGSQLDPNFLLHQFCSPFFIRQCVERATGGHYPAINDRNLRDVVIVAPPVEAQLRIVGQVDALQTEVDRLRVLQAETAAELDALLPAILDRAFKGEL